MANQLMASSSFSSAPSSTRSYTHDVFLSFRGEDTRGGFTGHLYRTLVDARIKTFIDDELPRGEEISPALFRAIDESKLSLIVFSENYAFSKWCLEELVHILECESLKTQMVYPIFYEVDPSDVRNQRGTYGKALAEHEGRFNKHKVSRWRAALTKAANLSGWHFMGGYEHEHIHKIVEEVSAQVREPTKLEVADYPVGVDSRVQAMLEILDVGGSDVRMVGIWGTGGIGKTTIAKAVYNIIAREFDVSCFLANVREESKTYGGLVKLQNVLLSAIVKKKGSEINNDYEGITLLRERLKDKRILLVVDDVDHLDQLKKLAGRTDWFGSGSRVIVTTRDKQLLFSHQVKQIHVYKARGLDHDEARELFLKNALRTNKNMDDDEGVAVGAVVEYAKGLPLALKVLGSHLFRRPIHEWRALLDGYVRSPLRGIHDILKISYDALEEQEREIFLDIACFFKNNYKNNVIEKLKGCGFSSPLSSIEILEEKALIDIEEYGRIAMHDLLEEMGKKVTMSPEEPGRRRRLWYHEDVLEVLTENTGTRNIRGIIVQMPTADEICLHPKCFERMTNLKVLINVNGRFRGKVDFPNQLRLFEWLKCPLLSLPSNSDMKYLVQLDMRHSGISHLGFKSMPNLKSLNLARCGVLAQSPDLSGSPKLELLDLSYCGSLVEVHPSVGSLKKLVRLNLSDCYNLVTLPGEVNWPSLQTINLNGCRKLESFPEIMGEMKYMTFLYLLCTGIKALPSSIRYLINLERLCIEDCYNFTNVPGSIYELNRLRKVSVENCPRLVTFPNKVESQVIPTCSKVSHDDPHSSSAGCSSLDPDKSALHLFLASRCNLSNINFPTCSKVSHDDPHSSSAGCSSLIGLIPLDRDKSALYQFLTMSVPTCSIVSHDDPHSSSAGCSSLDPDKSALHIFSASGCNLSNNDFLVSSCRASTLSFLDLSESPIVILPEYIIEFVNLEILQLRHCRKLVEIPELPPRIARLDVRGCLSLERISKLSNILKRKESQIMIEWMDFTDCWMLCLKLVEMVGEDDIELDALFSRLLSSQQSGFRITFPVVYSKVPEWFSCQMDFKGLRLFEFWIDALENFKWDNTGLAICVANGDSMIGVWIYINEVEVCRIKQRVGSDHTWLHYKPFHEMGEADYIRSLPPFTCRVIIHTRSYIKSCGVHLVMPPNEGVCMKLIRAENLTSEYPRSNIM